MDDHYRQAHRKRKRLFIKYWIPNLLYLDPDVSYDLQRVLTEKLKRLYVFDEEMDKIEEALRLHKIYITRSHIVQSGEFLELNDHVTIQECLFNVHFSSDL